MAPVGLLTWLCCVLVVAAWPSAAVARERRCGVDDAVAAFGAARDSVRAAALESQRGLFDEVAASAAVAASGESGGVRRRQGQQERSLVTIPVVMHVLYRNAAENVSDAVVDAQIAALNRDFQMANSDVSTMDPTFAPLVANPRIAFVKDRVLRVDSSSRACFTDDGSVPTFSPPVQPSRYLNLYSAYLSDTCTSSGDFLGYAQLPGGRSDRDVVVITPYCFGQRGAPTVRSPFDLGRTGTHEVGHWLGLPHIWGARSSCSYDDFVLDTPISQGPHYGCSSTPLSSCGHRNMIQNFMDYQNDACMVGFTHDQVERMRANLDDMLGWRRALAVPQCGDGVVQAPEECDDGPQYGLNDGCTQCQVGLGFSCPASGGACAPAPALQQCANVFHEPFDLPGPSHDWTVTQLSGSPTAYAGQPTATTSTANIAPVGALNASFTSNAALRINMQPASAGLRVESPSIRLPPASAEAALMLSFWMRLDTESGTTTSLRCNDAVRLTLVDETCGGPTCGGQSPIVLHAENVAYGGISPGSQDFNNGWCSMDPSVSSTYAQQSPATAALAGQQWRRLTVNLGAYAERCIRLRIETYQDPAVDSNDVTIDDLRIFSPCAPAGYAPAPCLVQTTGTTTGVPTSGTTTTTGVPTTGVPKTTGTTAITTSGTTGCSMCTPGTTSAAPATTSAVVSASSSTGDGAGSGGGSALLVVLLVIAALALVVVALIVARRYAARRQEAGQPLPAPLRLLAPRVAGPSYVNVSGLTDEFVIDGEVSQDDDDDDDDVLDVDNYVDRTVVLEDE